MHNELYSSGWSFGIWKLKLRALLRVFSLLLVGILLVAGHCLGFPGSFVAAFVFQ